jgi:hypothetical protein
MLKSTHHYESADKTTIEIYNTFAPLLTLHAHAKNEENKY